MSGSDIFAFFEYPIHLLLTYGYLSLFVWCLLEGEIGLMLAGWLASEGKVFTYEYVIYIAIIGAVIGDHILYILGRFFKKRAEEWLEAYGHKSQVLKQWFKKWGAFVIVFERFVYGTHIPALLSVGLSGYNYWKFLLFDVLGTVLWAVTFVSIGYYFGNHVINIILFAQKNILWILIAVSIVILLRQTKST
jgi:membrane protein DedA with SNARE-associated domain